MDTYIQKIIEIYHELSCLMDIRNGNYHSSGPSIGPAFIELFTVPKGGEKISLSD